MDPKELRIGNILKDGVVVNTIDECGINVKQWEDDGNTWERTFGVGDGLVAEPEPLTEEWLLKFGENYNDFWYQVGKLFIDKRDGTVCFENHRGIHINLNLKIEFVHTFQNLYPFFHNGEELTIIK